jgi:hypothetical protein
LESAVPNNNVQIMILFQVDKLKLNNILAELNVYKDTGYRKNEYNFISFKILVDYISLNLIWV